MTTVVQLGLSLGLILILGLTRLRSKVFSLNRLWTLSFGINSPSLRNRVNSGGWDWVDGLKSVPYPMESQQIKS